MSQTVRGQNVVVAGLGITGQACVRFLKRQQCNIKVWDTRTKVAIPDLIDVPVQLGGELPDGYWQGVDLLVVSPGISLAHPGIVQAGQAGVEIIGEIELFARYNKTRAFGITGSNGKTTVVLLLTHILQSAGMKACAAGNVGTPALDTLERDLDVVVLELSSFQLETTSSLKLAGATILNVSDDHLDRHGSMGAYVKAKHRIFAHAQHAVCWREQAECLPPAAQIPVIRYALTPASEDFGVTDGWITRQQQPVLELRKVKLVGAHNVLNIMAALAFAELAGVDLTQAAEAVYSFISAPHRCVEIARTQGVSWVDDSKATNVGAALAAIEGIGAHKNGKLILIAGGDGKGADLTALKTAINKHVDWTIGLGRDGHIICQLTPDSEYVNSLQEAVRKAHSRAVSGDIVLLSPACASLDMFENYMHRAQVFADAVREVAA